MAVRIHMTSGQDRVVVGADGARIDGALFIVTSQLPKTQHTVLTLWAKDVVLAEIEMDGVVIESVPGASHTAKS